MEKICSPDFELLGLLQIDLTTIRHKTTGKNQMLKRLKIVFVFNMIRYREFKNQDPHE